MPSNGPLNIIPLGRSGSGKGTQAKLLAKKFGLKHISSGDLFRTLAKEDTFVGRKTKETLKRGRLFADWFAFWLWVNELIKLDSSQGIILDGASRRLEEAKSLDKVFSQLERPNLKVILIDISRQEAIKRLLGRARKDDNRQAIKKRLDWFDKDVMPSVRYYEKTGRLIRINGQQSVEGVFKEILAKLKVKNQKLKV